jgi:hypothetical protein
MQPVSTDALKLMLLKKGHHMKINRIAMTSAVVLAGVFGMTQGPLAQTPGQAPSAKHDALRARRSIGAPGTPGSVPGSTDATGIEHDTRIVGNGRQRPRRRGHPSTGSPARLVAAGAQNNSAATDR